MVGRCRHSSCAHNDKVYTFGGCFMYNRKRQLRECTSQVAVYDTVEETYYSLKTKGVTVQPRKDHSASVMGNSMIVYGGQFENGVLVNEMLNLDLQFYDWNNIYPKGISYEPFFQAQGCAVQGVKKASANGGGMDNAITRMSDAILDGIYYFGGKNAKGEHLSYIRYLKTTISEGKVTMCEWQKIKQQGIAPCGRTGHTMVYLPINQCLLVAGGRNDKECKSLNIPFLDDMHLFLLDQKAWVQIKYIPQSLQICKIGNHSMTVASDG